MSCQFVALYYEGNINDWLRLRFPNRQTSAVVNVAPNTYHILVSDSDAAAIRNFVSQGINPPFTRRTLDPPGTPRPRFEPGLCFGYYNDQWSVNELTRTVAAYESILPRLAAVRDRSYVQSRIASLKARLPQ